FRDPAAWAARLRDLLAPGALRAAHPAVARAAAAYGALLARNEALIAARAP
ncbi:MAG: hypothetical protein IT577_24445, partial [Verrucomicrobiae bacterium]|nr:hypothetical protein [Verrucomicrobiae bacterium]